METKIHVRHIKRKYYVSISKGKIKKHIGTFTRKKDVEICKKVLLKTTQKSYSMTNKERWLLYTKDLSSPQSFVEFGFYYLISAALQRRVWVGPEHAPIYPNMYVILCGKPGVGKGLVVKQVVQFLSYFKIPRPTHEQKVVDASAVKSNVSEKEAIEMVLTQNYARSTHGQNTNGNSKPLSEEPLLIPMAADATTFQALCRAMANSYAGIVYKDKSGGSKVYTHSSLCFCLEEISSLFSKHCEGVSHFLLNTYDCGDYTYDTIGRGKDRIKKCCLNFFGGTTPSFMQETFNDKILNDGFSSRTFYIFEYANRSNEIFIPELTTEQRVARTELLYHIQKLTTLFGQAVYTDEARSFLADWWRKFPTMPRPNASLKLDSYYSRKNIHVQKLAMAIHYSESFASNTINLMEVKQAMKMLDEVEKKMHYALSFGEKNPLAVASKKVLAYLQREGRYVSLNELLLQLWDDIRDTELNEVMSYLRGTEQVEVRTTDKTTEYKMKEKKV